MNLFLFACFLCLFTGLDALASGAPCHGPHAKSPAHISRNWFGQARDWKAKLTNTTPVFEQDPKIRGISNAIRFESAIISNKQSRHIPLSLRSETLKVSSKDIYVAFKSAASNKTQLFRPLEIDGRFIKFNSRGFGDYQLVELKGQ